MLIAHLITDLQSAGAENQLQQFVLASDRRRFQHVVISLLEGGTIAAELSAAGIEVHSLGMRRTFPSPFGMTRLIRLLRRLKPEVLHCWLYHPCIVGLLGERLAGVQRLIWSLRSANWGLHGYSLSTRAVVVGCARMSFLSDAIIVNSESSKAMHQGLGYKTTRMKVISNGIDGERFSPNSEAPASVREELGIARDAVLVGLVARYHPMKDHETFLRAAALVHRQCPQVRFVFAGKGMISDNQPLWRLVEQNGLQHAVRLLGSRRDIPRLTAALDVACLSSWSESFPNVVLEAMACEVPCVVTNVGDCSSIVGTTGRVVPPHDPLALAGAMVELVEMPSVERAALGQAARTRVLGEFTLQKTVSAYEQVYDDSFGTNVAQALETIDSPGPVRHD